MKFSFVSVSRKPQQSGSYAPVGTDHKTYLSYLPELYTDCCVLKQWRRKKMPWHYKQYCIYILLTRWITVYFKALQFDFNGHVWKTCNHFSLFKVCLLVVVWIMWNIQPVNSWVKAVQESNTEFANTNSEFAIHFTFALVTDTDLPMEISNFTCKIAASFVRELQCILFSCKDYILDICSKKELVHLCS